MARQCVGAVCAACLAAGTQKSTRTAGQSGHGKKRGEDALQRFVVFVYRRSVFHHRRIPLIGGRIVARVGKAWMRLSEESYKRLKGLGED